MAINHAAIILIVCGVLAIAAILAGTGIFLWLDRRRTRRIQQLTVTAKGKDRDVDTMPGEVASTSMGPVPVTDAAPPEGHNSELQLTEHHFPPPSYRPRRFSAYPTPPDSIQEYGIELSPPATPPVSNKTSKAPQSIPWGRQAMNARKSTARNPDDATGPPPPSIKWQTSRDRVSAVSARSGSGKAVDISPPTARLPSSQRTQASSAQTAPFDLHDFPLPPIPIITADPQSAPPVLGADRDREHRRASTLYEPRESAYSRRSFVQGGSWQSPPPSARRQPQPRRAATAPMDGLEALKLARKGSHLDIPLSAMGGGNLDFRRREMQRQRSS
ncbi:hypothetical protein GSI_08538 [Ganoderma sinense ZZ0214-1]|uniref:Uncharacterized protein n=1 Tax=Ganoderma sinense ZZ0214-1 TaxID=1077348 RepID=A0A2G8S402_9APHY|nr:hypothetical protein GSI_08538 [Ganoderma sinense ZZ0214-1]